MDGNSTLASV